MLGQQIAGSCRCEAMSDFEHIRDKHAREEEKSWLNVARHGKRLDCTFNNVQSESSEKLLLDRWEKVREHVLQCSDTEIVKHLLVENLDRSDRALHILQREYLAA